MDQAIIIQELDSLIRECNEKVIPTKWDPTDYDIISFNTYVNADVYKSWRSKAITFLKLFLNDNSEFINLFLATKENYLSSATTCLRALEEIKEYILKGFIPIECDSQIDIDSILNRLFSRFHKVARQLRSRYSERNTLEVEDEYDVQDLLHALLKLYFDDIRAEEWTPSYAGKSARVDFLLKNEKTVIEVKKTRHGLADKELGDQLIVDVDRYKSHPDCDKLICFVYDPEGRIVNAAGIMKDMNERHKGFATVIIEPNV